MDKIKDFATLANTATFMLLAILTYNYTHSVDERTREDQSAKEKIELKFKVFNYVTTAIKDTNSNSHTAAFLLVENLLQNDDSLSKGLKSILEGKSPKIDSALKYESDSKILGTSASNLEQL